MSTPKIVSIRTVAGAAVQTGVVTNVAWILASAGKRVLVIDRATGGPRVRDGLRMCPNIALGPSSASGTSDALGDGGSDTIRGGGGREPDRRWCYEPQGLPGRIEVVEPSSADRQSFAGRSGRSIQRLAREFATSPVDYVLDHRSAGGADARADRTPDGVDAVIVCFLARSGPVLAAFNDVRELLDLEPYGLTVIGVALSQDPVATHVPELAVQTFAVLAGHGRDRPGLSTFELVSAPFEADGNSFQLHRMLADPPNSPSSSTMAYVGIATLLAGDFGNRATTPERLHRHYSWSIHLAGPGPSDVLWIAYGPGERLWAERLTAWLRAAGAAARRLPLARQDMDILPRPGNTILLVLSATSDVAADLRRLGRLTAVNPAAAGVNLIGIDVEGEIAGSDAIERRIHLGNGNRPDQRRVLLSGLGLFGIVEDRIDEQRVRTENSRPAHDPRFVGRETELENLRDAFAPDGNDAASEHRHVTLVGAAGVGKSGIAVEYVHRFAEVYKGIWWIQAPDKQAARAGLASIARTFQSKLSVTSGSEDALEHLRKLPPTHRWLVVFDNVAGEPPNDLFAGDNVTDVIVTTTDGRTESSGHVIRVGPLGNDDGREILTGPASGIVGLSQQDADAIIELSGRLPLPLTLAREIVRATSSRLLQQGFGNDAARDEAVRRLIAALGGAARRDQSVVSRMLAFSCETVGVDGTGRAAVALAELATFLSPDGASLGLVCSRPMRAQIAAAAGPGGEDALLDELWLDRAMATGARFGLYDIDWGPDASLRMHRVLQRGMRELMEPADTTVRQSQVLQALSLVAQLRAAGADTGAMLGELRRHLRRSGALDVDRVELEQLLGHAGTVGTDAWAVRRWVVVQVEHTLREGENDDWQAEVNFADDIERRWTARFGRGDLLRCRMADRKADLLRKLGRVQESCDTDMDVLAELTRRLGAEHPRTWVSASGLAADLRGLGRFEEAMIEDEAVWAGFSKSLGPDHPASLDAGNNLAVSRFLMGRTKDALTLHASCHEHRARTLGKDHRYYRSSLRRLAVYYRESGQYDEAAKQLELALRGTGPRSPDTDLEDLRIRRVRHVNRRRAGTDSPVESLNEGAFIVEEHRKMYEPDHLHTLAARMSHAFDLHFVDRADEAVKTVTDCLDRYLGQSGGHPFAGVFRANLAVFQRSAGYLKEANASGNMAISELGARFADVHPWVLSAVLNHPRTIALSHDVASAVSALRSVGSRGLEYLGEKHPVTKAAAANLAAVEDNPLDVTGQVWRDIDIDIPLT